MIRKIIASLLILFGIFIVTVLIHDVRYHIQLKLFGEHASGHIVEAIPVGTKHISKSIYNSYGSIPSLVDTYDLIARFATAKGEFQSATRLTYYQIDELVDRSFKVKPIAGHTVDIIYLANNPTRNQIDHALPWDDFWYPIIGGLAFTVFGTGLFIVRPPRRLPKRHQ